MAARFSRLCWAALVKRAGIVPPADRRSMRPRRQLLGPNGSDDWVDLPRGLPSGRFTFGRGSAVEVKCLRSRFFWWMTITSSCELPRSTWSLTRERWWSPGWPEGRGVADAGRRPAAPSGLARSGPARPVRPRGHSAAAGPASRRGDHPADPAGRPRDRHVVLRAGADDFLAKANLSTELLPAIRRVARARQTRERAGD